MASVTRSFSVDRIDSSYSTLKNSIIYFVSTSAGHFTETVKLGSGDVEVTSSDSPIVCVGSPTSWADKVFASNWAYASYSGYTSAYIGYTSSDVIYASSYKTGSTGGARVTVKDEHGTHLGFPTGEEWRMSYIMVLGVKHATTNPGWKFTGWVLSVKNTASVLVSDAGSYWWNDNLDRHVVISAGGTRTQPGDGYTYITFSDGYEEAVCVRIYPSSGSAYNLTIEATYEQAYNITYESEGEVRDLPDDATVSPGSSYTIPSTSPSRTGYEFQHYTSGSKIYNPGDTIADISSDITLTVVWTAIVYTVSVSYSSVGKPSGMPVPSTIEVPQNSTITLPSAPSLEGYHFDGWNDGTKTQDAETSYTVGTLDVAFTAQWTGLTTYSIAYASAGSPGNMPSNASVYAGASYTIPSNEPTRTNYTFDHWNDGTRDYDPGDSYGAVNANVTFTAVWISLGPTPSGSGLLACSATTGCLVYVSTGALGHQ